MIFVIYLKPLMILGKFIPYPPLHFAMSRKMEQIKATERARFGFHQVSCDAQIEYKI